MQQKGTTESLADIDNQLDKLRTEKSEFIRQHRFDDNEDWRIKLREYNAKIDELTDKGVEIEKAQKAAEKEAKERIEREERKKKVESARRNAISDYNKQIEKLEKERFSIIESGSDDYETTDKLYAEIERLEGRKRIIENGGFTLDQATITQTPYVVDPNTSSMIKLDKADVYTMPDGKQFVFKSGMNKAHQTLTPEELINAYYEMPQKVRDNSQNVVAVVDRYNPADTYWRKTYKNFSHSYMTGGEGITVYRCDYQHDKEYLRFSLDHEAGHFVDRANRTYKVDASESQEWIDAMAKDKKVSGRDSMRSYGTNSRSEDFADSVAYYITDHDTFAKTMPNRASVLDRLLGIGGASP
jgi:hypothetical protein